MFRQFCIIPILILIAYQSAQGQKQADYKNYHQQMIIADQDIASGRYQEALTVMEQVFGHYDFVFLRDYQIAAQIAVYIHKEQKAFGYLRAAIADGWTLTEIRKNKLLSHLQADTAWRSLVKQYPALHRRYLRRLDVPMQNILKQMFHNDQKLAVENMKIIDDKAQDEFLMHRFVPQSERQVKQIHELILQKGYPGEKRIGNTFWASVILSHHNSVSPAYVMQDKLYPALRPLLIKAIATGDLSPGDFALIEDWRITVGSDHKIRSYGYLNTLTVQDLPKANQLRQDIGLPPIELRNQLVDVQKKTDINFYLEGTTWVKGKIPVVKQAKHQ
jgi:hypothetical protein